MKYARGVTVALEMAHHGMDGKLHGHSLLLEVWTRDELDLDAWKAQVAAVVDQMEGKLEDTIEGRTFEEVGAALLRALPQADRVVVRLPSRGHLVEVCR